MRTARILAVTVCAVLGVLGGVGAGVLLDQHEAGQDPLGLGVTQVDQPCSGEFLLVTAWGVSGSAIGPGITADPDKAHYLEVAHSCATAWKPTGTHTEGYVAYLGPYSDSREACAERVRRRGSFVTRLHRGNERAVQCLCLLSETSLPRLTPGMVVDAQVAIYVRSLQDLLATMRLLSTNHEYIGRYDPLTVRAIKQVQAEAGLRQTGVVDLDTWHSVIRQGCQDITE